MNSTERSRSSSPLSSIPQSFEDSLDSLDDVPSSPLSSIARTPSPPPGWAAVTPPPSQDAGEELPRPRKRRKIERPDRTTRYLDLTEDTAQSHFDRTDSIKELQKALRNRRKIVVIAGAGISVSAGIPDFRSSNGLFASLKGEHKIKGGSGKQLFDAAVYKDAHSTSQFHQMVRKLSKMSQHAKPTSFHHMLARLATEGRLLRLYTQNVDGLETQMPPLGTEIPLPHKGPWPQTVQLHGGLEKMMCQKCREIMDFDAKLFDGSEPPACPKCQQTDDFRTNDLGRRSHGIGRLRPRIVLYNEANPDDESIGAVSAADMRTRPDAIVVVGTSMKIPGVRRIVSEMCKIVRGRRDGTTIWINPDPEPTGPQFEDCWDLIVKGNSDQVAGLANLRKWDDPIDENLEAPTEYTDSDLEKVNARQGTIKVNLPPSPCKKIERPPAIAVLTPPGSQNGEAPQDVKSGLPTTTPIRIKLVVGAKSESAEKEQRNKQVQVIIPKLIKNPASGGRKLKDVLGKDSGDNKKAAKTSYKRKTMSKAKSTANDQSQSKIEAKVTKSRNNIEVRALAKKEAYASENTGSPMQTGPSTERTTKSGDRPEAKFKSRLSQPVNLGNTFIFEMGSGQQQNKSFDPSDNPRTAAGSFAVAAQVFPSNKPLIANWNSALISEGSTPALVSGNTTPHESPAPQTPPMVGRGIEGGSSCGSPSSHGRHDTISPKGNVPRDMMRLLN